MMYRFIRKIIIFMMLPILYFGTNMIINYFIYNKQPVDIKNTNVIIVGDSHPEKSLIPKYFYDAQNISQPGEPYVLTYWKLKKIFNSYIPDTLIIGFAPQNITQYNDLKFSDERWSSEMFKRSYPIQEFTEISNAISVNYKTFYKVLWKQTAFYPKTNHVNYIGNYSNINRSDLSDSIFAIETHYYHKGAELNVSKTAVNHLDSIIQLCNSKNIELIMTSNPVHEKYLKKIPDVIMNKYVGLTNKYRIDHIMYNKTTEKYPDSLYLNSDHLNDNGAKKFTQEFIDYLKNR